MKRILALLLAVCTILCFSACANTTKQPSETAASSALTTTPSSPATEPTTPPIRSMSYYEMLIYLGKHSSDEPLNIPVRSEEFLLFKNICAFTLGSDASWSYRKIDNKLPVSSMVAIEHYCARTVVEYYPTELRVSPDCTSYAVYDTDTGYRVYIFFTPMYCGLITGYPIVLNKSKPLLSYNDFKDIQIGDSIEKVEAIDDVATLQKRATTTERIGYSAAGGDPFTTVHYLKDGILLFQYGISEESKVVVTNIIHDWNHIIANADGVDIRYTIADIDLPIPLHH